MKPLFHALLFCFSLQSLAQELNLEEAETLFLNKRFSGVLDYYRGLLKKDSLNSKLNYKIAVCYLNSRSQKEKSIRYFEKALIKNDLGKEKQSNIYKLLGDAYYSISDYDQAILHYEKYKNSSSTGSHNDISKEIEMCKMANDLKDLKELTSKLTDSKSGGKRNKQNLYSYQETSLAKKQQSSISFPKKKSSSKNEINGNRFFEEIQDAGRYNFKRDLKKIDTTDNRMETTIATSVDGQIILIYRDDYGYGNLYSSSLHGNEWMAPVKLSRNIMNKNWEEDEFISTNGKELYFSSDREGGFGGKDIYKCLKLANDEWGKAINMGSRINTPFDEEAPYLLPDGSTLYFSSNRNRKKNYFDNFSSFYSDSAGWTIPVNVGYPLNKTSDGTYNDSISTISNKANFIATFINPQDKPITILSGTIQDNTNIVPFYIEITIANNETSEIIGIYHPTSNNGRYSFIIPPGKNQNITYESEGYLFHSENINLSNAPSIYQLNKLIELESIRVGAKIKLNNLFFEEGSTSLSNTSEIELNNLIVFLKKNSSVKIEIAAYLNKAGYDGRKKQTEERLNSIINYLSDKGINKTNIQLKIYKTKKNKIKSNAIEVETKVEQLELKILSLK